MDRKANGSPLRNIIAATVMGAALAGGGYFFRRNSIDAPAPVEATPSAPAVVTSTVMPDITLRRTDLIRLSAEAADASSGGPAVEDMLEGRRFIIRVPFSCGDITGEEERAYGARYTVEDRTLRIRVLQQDWTSLPWVAAELAPYEADGAEGFWIPRPWTQSETCPSGDGDPDDPSSSLGIVQVFDPASSRVGQRRGRPLESTVQLDPEEADLSKGLRLVIEGRVARWPMGRETVLCRPAQVYERPVCLVAAKLDTVSVENASNGDRLADWRF